MKLRSYAPGLSYSEVAPLRTTGRTMPLFCVDAGNFLHMATAMNGDQPVYGLRIVNMNMNLSVEKLATMHLEQICKIQKHGPYRFAGYSFGGLVVYEMASILANRGEEVSLLALMDTPQPALLRSLSPTELRHFHKTYFASRVAKYSRNLIRGRIDLVLSDAVKLLSKLTPIAFSMIQRLSRVLNFSMPNIICNDSTMLTSMWNSYTPNELKGRMVLFRAQDRGPEFDDDPSMGWQKLVTDGVDVHFVSADHETMMQMPHVLTLVDKLQPYLNSSQEC